MLIDDLYQGQIVALGNFKVSQVMGGGNLHHSGAEIFIYRLVGHH